MKLFCRALIVVPVLLAGCANSRPVSNAEYQSNTTQDTGGAVAPSFLGDSSFELGVKKTKNGAGAGEQGTGLGVNAYLWRGTLDTLGFMPLASADPFGGVVITDWWGPDPTSNERFKVTAYILGRQLRADGVKLSVFRQVQQNGQWVTAPVAAGTTAEIENKILARARELRTQSTAAN